jgi:hypothetical protein
MKDNSRRRQHSTHRRINIRISPKYFMPRRSREQSGIAHRRSTDAHEIQFHICSGLVERNLLSRVMPMAGHAAGLTAR